MLFDLLLCIQPSFFVQVMQTGTPSLSIPGFTSQIGLFTDFLFHGEHCATKPRLCYMITYAIAPCCRFKNAPNAWARRSNFLISNGNERD